jgi:hypothetical protein
MRAVVGDIEADAHRTSLLPGTRLARAPSVGIALAVSEPPT